MSVDIRTFALPQADVEAAAGPTVDGVPPETFSRVIAAGVAAVEVGWLTTLGVGVYAVVRLL